MSDFHEHKLLAHPIAAGEVDLSCATQTRCEAVGYLMKQWLNDI